jgi:hypothetical protein
LINNNYFRYLLQQISWNIKSIRLKITGPTL